MVVKSTKIENPIRDFFRTLGLFFLDVNSKKQRENVASRIFIPISVLFAILSVFTLIYIILDSTENEDEIQSESRKWAKNSMIYILFSITVILTMFPLIALFLNKRIPLVWITG